MRLSIAAIALVLIAGCAAEPTPPTLAQGWNEFTPGGETICSDGTPFRFYVRPGDPEKVMFYLEGGGACWFRQNCDPAMQPSYTINLEGRHPSQRGGVFDLSREDNPLRGYTHVFAPYCSGDVHLGAEDHVYDAVTEGQDALTVRHRGIANVQAVLDWTYANLQSPATVFVTGSSAGSIPSPYYAMKIAQHYPDARVVQLGDGSGGYRRTDGSQMPYQTWGAVEALRASPEYAGLNDTNFDFVVPYLRTATATPNVQLAAYDAAEDAVQKRFLALSGTADVSLLGMIQANQADIRQDVPGFRSFIAGGESHTILGLPAFYTFRVGDTTFRDWLDDLVNGRPVDDVICEPCETAELTTPAP